MSDKYPILIKAARGVLSCHNCNGPQPQGCHAAHAHYSYDCMAVLCGWTWHVPCPALPSPAVLCCAMLWPPTWGCDLHTVARITANLCKCCRPVFIKAVCSTQATPKAQLEVASAQPVPTRHVRKPQQAQQAQQAQQSSAQQVSARPVSKSQQAQQAQQALRSMAESLKRAYDEGRLKERSPVGNALSWCYNPRESKLCPHFLRATTSAKQVLPEASWLRSHTCCLPERWKKHGALLRRPQ